MTTPQKTDAEFLAALPLVGGRLGVGLLELKRRLKAEMPGRLAAVNAALQLSGNGAYQVPRDVVLAPVPVDDKFLNTVVIEYTSRLVPHARMFRKETNLQIFIPDRRIEIESQATDALDRSDIILTILEAYKGGCTDLQGRKAWDFLEPQGVSVLPEAWKKYSGISLSFQMIQTPTPNIWSVK